MASTVGDSRDMLFAGIEDRKRELIERGVRLCLSSYGDGHGTPKAKAVPIETMSPGQSVRYPERNASTSGTL